ncbi:hypothetical protein F5Y01DRAFT_66961 [Xylaria sp. FL0043]|nr:hypothetical protein F5Y01DRAFT_66961 [Xylaria sp. FL0043]
MDSSFVEQTHANPDHGSVVGPSVRDVTVTGVGTVTAVTTAAHRGLISGDGGGNNDSPDLGTAAAVVTPAVSPAALTSRSGSEFFSSAHAHAHAPAPAPAPAAAAPSQAPQAPEAFHPSSSTSSTPNLNSHPPPPSSSPSSRHSILHAHRQSHNSSKLPAYRFADLNKEPIALPLLLQQQHQQHHRIPPSPVSPDSDQRPETQPNTVNQVSPQPTPEFETTQNRDSNRSVDDVVSPPPSSEQLDPAGSRASTLQPKSASLPATTSSAHLARSASLDTTNAPPNTTGVRSPSGSTETIVPALKRRAPPSPIPPSGPEADAVSGGSSAEATKRRRESSSAQRELLLPKTLQRTTSDDRRASISRKPPVSYRPRTSISGSGTGASIPPIRSFRSSGERRSLVLDMNLRTSRNLDGGDDYGDSNHRDRTLRALEGRRGDEVMQWTPPDSAGERPDGDDSGDLFLKIAREDSSQRTPDSGRTYHADNSNAISRVARSARRPLSVATSPYQSPSYRSPSPPRMSRRLSEQESRIRGLGNDQGERAGPPVSYRGHSREPHSEDFKFRGAPTSLRASPLTPRTLTFQDHSEPNSAHRRRQPSVDRGSLAFTRATSLKQVNVNFSHPRTFNSSPLVPQAAEPQRPDAQPNESTPVEGTDSTTSTAAPSTVWDELEELKSRIHRLELTGKLPPTSSAAISRASDERPPTANTNATTLSASPKRGASSVVQSVETATVPKDSHPLLNSALAKSKEFITPEVYDALEAATVDALTLAAMMGTAGQPGPISSGNSNIGSSTGTVTDRQLRKKADSVCRSLTELCLALSENAGAAKHQQITPPPAEDVTVTSPTITQFSGFATQRRPSAPANRAIELATSPRTASRYEEKRATILQASALPSPRYSSNAPTSTDAAAAGRKSSLLFSRARRAGTEEPEDGRRTSTLLTSRRAGTEEPEDLANRKPILSRGLSRGRRATLDNGEDDSRLRTPSRAVTEVNGLRPREYISHLPPPPITKEADTLANSALPRRRLGSTVINTRLAQPAAVTTPTSASAIVTPNRRYFDRPTPSRETAPEGDRVTEDRPQRQFSLARSGSLNRRVTNRQSTIVTPSTTTTGYYR